jgi:hypothetical protein
MARKSTTYDPFNAVSEPKRRLILETIARNKELSYQRHRSITKMATTNDFKSPQCPENDRPCE